MTAFPEMLLCIKIAIRESLTTKKEKLVYTSLDIAEMKRRTYVDLMGGHVEISSPGVIVRATIDKIFWWETHLCRLYWTYGAMWNTESGTWECEGGGDGFLFFPRKYPEKFSKPIEMDTREILILYSASAALYITLFPIGLELPDSPFDVRTHLALYDRAKRIDGAVIAA